MTTEITTTGMIIKETKVGEGNKIFTILTAEHGKIQASGAGVRSYKSKLSAGCSLFCYSNFILKQGKSKTIYNIVSAEKQMDFYDLRYDLHGLALTNYLCDLANYYTDSNMECKEILRLILNTVYYIKKEGYNPKIKPVFEFRLLTESGFSPDFYSCSNCGNDKSLVHFSVENSAVLCKNCSKAENLSQGTLDAIRYITSTEQKNIFNFEISDDVLTQLTNLAEEYLLHNLGKVPKSLIYLKSL